MYKSLRVVALVAVVVLMLTGGAVFNVAYGIEPYAEPTTEPTTEPASEEANENAIKFFGVDEGMAENVIIYINTPARTNIVRTASGEVVPVRYIIDVLEGSQEDLVYETVTVDETEYLELKASEFIKFRIIAVDEETQERAEIIVTVVSQSLGLMDIIMLAIGAYALFYAIRGKGSLFDVSTVRDGLEKKYTMVVRITCVVVGVILIVTGLFKVIDEYARYGYIATALFGCSIVALIASIIITRRMIDKEKREKARTAPRGAANVSPPLSAFEFSGDEPTLDDVLNKKE